MKKDDEDLRDNSVFQALVKELWGQSDQQLERFGEWLNNELTEESDDQAGSRSIEGDNSPNDT